MILHMHNIVFIDGQNLYFRTLENNWKIDYKKFSIYLKEKYSVSTIYYFIGYKSEKFENLYLKLESADFTIIFKEHNEKLFSQKKGNIDTDMVFEIMKTLVDNIDFDKILIVSSDGDYKKIVDYLILKKRFLNLNYLQIFQ